MASTSAPPWLMANGARTEGQPTVHPSGMDLLHLRHRRQRTTTRPPPNLGSGPPPPHPEWCTTSTTPRAHTPTVSPQPPGTGPLGHGGHPVLSVGRWRQAVGGRQSAWHGRPGTATKPGQPPGTPATGTRPASRVPHNLTVALVHKYPSTTVKPLNFAIRSGFWTRRRCPQHAAASFLSPAHLKPAGTCQERAKTQVSVHKGGVS